MRKALLSIFLLASTLVSQAQLPCGTALYENDHHADHPMLGNPSSLNEDLEQEMLSNRGGERADKIIVPVVFTILHDNGDENISDHQIRDAMRVLNEDFNAENPELDDIVSAFQDRIGDAEIEFRLATKDPNGNFTTGVQRIKSDKTYIGDNNSKINGWNRSMYMNIWTSDVITVVGASASAFSTNPIYNPQANPDGIIANHRYLGVVGTAISNGHTLAHEMGHWLSLHHTWGTTNFPGCDGTATNQNDPCFGVNNCGFDDGVSDTPGCLGVDDFTCNLSQNSCGSLDNVQNHMDYATCESMFTEGQTTRMRAALNSNANAAYQRRRNLVSDDNLEATGVVDLSEAKYYVASHTACRGQEVQFYDESRYDPDSWSWEITGPETLTSEEQHPVFTFKTNGYYTVKLTVTQGSITESIEDVDAFYVGDEYGVAVPFTEDFEDPMEGWITVNNGFLDDEYQWEYRTSGGFDDDACYRAKNLGNNDHKLHDDLILGGVDFRPMDKVNISFKVAFERAGNDNNDQLLLFVSNDCGDSWKQVWARTADVLDGDKPLSSGVFEPESEDDWEEFTVQNIPMAWLGEDALIKFSFEPGGGNHLYIDDINIDGEYTVVPFLVYPSNGASEMNNNVLLDWRAVVGASSYEYQLSKNDAFTATVNSGTLDVINDKVSDNSDTQFKTADLENGQTYFWRVRSKVNGTNSEWSDTWSFTVANDGVGIESLDPMALKVYPNPAESQLTVESIQVIDGIKIMDVSGRLVRAWRSNSTKMDLDVRSFQPGTYFMKVLAEDGSIQTQPVVIR